MSLEQQEAISDVCSEAHCDPVGIVQHCLLCLRKTRLCLECQVMVCSTFEWLWSVWLDWRHHVHNISRWICIRARVCTYVCGHTESRRREVHFCLHYSRIMACSQVTVLIKLDGVSGISVLSTFLLESQWTLYQRTDRLCVGMTLACSYSVCTYQIPLR